MIITLKGADFSASNIGTLSSWRITRSLGTGATYDGVTSVDKGAAFSATVTIAEGYELGATGVAVTMGGEIISAATVNGNVITISIAEVTGNVVIKVPTVNISGGDEPVVPQQVDITSAFGPWTAGGPVFYYGGYTFTDVGDKDPDGKSTKSTRLQYSAYVDVSNYSSLTMTLCARKGTTATGGYCFYTDANYQSFISEGSDDNHGNGADADGVTTITTAIPANARYMRTTYWVDGEAAKTEPFSCIATTKVN